MQFQHHPDGLIYLEDLCLPLEFFLKQESGYSLPDGMTHRLYVQGKHHLLYSSDSQSAGEMPWLKGDRYLSKIADYEAAWNESQPLLVQPPSTAIKWQDFRTQILTDPGYDRIIKQTTDQRSVTRLENVAGNSSQDWLMLQQFWNAVVNGVVVKPSVSEINQWQAIATAAHMPFAFGLDGKMVVSAR